MPKTIKERFDDKWVEKDMGYITPCHIWIGSLTGSGYGQIAVNGKKVYSHVLAWEMKNNQVRQSGHEIDHLCKIKFCVNPEHLEHVTILENRRRQTKNNQNTNKTHCPYNHEYTPENTYYQKNGARECRRCRFLTNAKRPIKTQRRKLKFLDLQGV